MPWASSTESTPAFTDGNASNAHSENNNIFKECSDIALAVNFSVSVKDKKN